MCSIIKWGINKRQRAFDLEFPFLINYHKYKCEKHNKFFTLFHPIILNNLNSNIITMIDNIPIKLVCFSRTIFVSYFYLSKY